MCLSEGHTQLADIEAFAFASKLFLLEKAQGKQEQDYRGKDAGD
jgi:hypothetical protein